MTAFLLHFGLAIALFFILNWIGSHSIHVGYIRMSILAKADEAPAFNFLYRAFSPVAYITIVSAILYGFKQEWLIENIYLVVVYYFIFRLFFNLITGKGLLLNWVTQAAYILVSVPASYYVYDKLIIHKEFLFPTAKELGSAVWLAIVVYIYHTFNNVKLSDQRTIARKARYLDNRYSRYKSKFGDVIESIAETRRQEALVYAVLITEAFNRPKLYRLVESFLFHLGMAKTLGIMQVTTNIYIDDRMSVELGAKKIVDDHLKAKLTVEQSRFSGGSWAIRREVLQLYNPDSEYIREVDALYEEIIEKYYPDEKTDWEEEVGIMRREMIREHEAHNNSSQQDASDAGASA